MVRIWELQNENDCILTSENSESASQHMTVGRALQQHLVHFKEGGTEAWCIECPTDGNQRESQDLYTKESRFLGQRDVCGQWR